MAPVTVFDLDDTLFPELDYARSGLRTAGAYLESEYGCEGASDRLVDLLEAGVRGEHFDIVIEEYDLDPSLLPELVRIYREHEPDIDFFPHAIDVLREARELGPVAILTDGYRSTQRRKIEALELESRVDFVVVTDELNGEETWKPAPTGYRRIMRHFEVDGEACCYVGDNPEKDFVAARRLGWTTILFDRPDQMYEREVPDADHEPHHRIERLPGLFEIWPERTAR